MKFDKYFTVTLYQIWLTTFQGLNRHVHMCGPRNFGPSPFLYFSCQFSIELFSSQEFLLIMLIIESCHRRELWGISFESSHMLFSITSGPSWSIFLVLVCYWKAQTIPILAALSSEYLLASLLFSVIKLVRFYAIASFLCSRRQWYHAENVSLNDLFSSTWILRFWGNISTFTVL